MPEPTRLSQEIAGAYLRRIIGPDGRLVMNKWAATHHLAAILDEVAVQTLEGALLGFGARISMN